MPFSFDLDDKRTVRIAVLGVGQVGLRVCHLFASNGYQVCALDIDRDKIERLRQAVVFVNDDALVRDIPRLVGSGMLVPSTAIEEYVAQSNVVIVCIPTRVRDGTADVQPFITVAKTISRSLKRGSLVIFESTTYPSAIDNVIKPILEESGLKVAIDFGLAHCPERVDPGNRRFTISNIPRVIGASDAASLAVAKKLYESVLRAPVFAVSNIKTAEITKLVENTFRDVNIAFVNELARALEGTEIDLIEAINAAATKPFAFIPHYPGPGVGGNCIPVSPIWLLEFCSKNKKNLRLVRLAREINDSMAEFVVEKLCRKLMQYGTSPEKTTVLVLGLTYKANERDTSNSPSRNIISALKRRNIRVYGCDPFLTDKEVEEQFGIEARSIDRCECDALIISVCHEQFKDLPSRLRNLGKRIIVFDARNAFDSRDFDQTYVRLAS